MSGWVKYVALFALFALALDIVRKSMRASVSNTTAEGKYFLYKNGVPDARYWIQFQTVGEHSDVARVTDHEGITKAYTMRSLTQGAARDGSTLDITGAYLVIDGKEFRRADDHHSRMLMDGAIHRP